jgi:hypothetical protein
MRPVNLTKRVIRSTIRTSTDELAKLLGVAKDTRVRTTR